MKIGSIALLGLAAAGVATIAIIASRKSGEAASEPAVTSVPTRVLASGAIMFGNAKDRDVPSDFDGAGNTVGFLNGCTSVVVGAQLWTMAGGMQCSSSGGDLKSALGNGQNLCAHIAYLMKDQGIQNAGKVLAAIIAGLEPPCLTTPSSEWPNAMKSFVNWLAPLVTDYVITAGGNDSMSDSLAVAS